MVILSAGWLDGWMDGEADISRETGVEVSAIRLGEAVKRLTTAIASLFLSLFFLFLSLPLYLDLNCSCSCTTSLRTVSIGCRCWLLDCWRNNRDALILFLSTCLKVGSLLSTRGPSIIYHGDFNEEKTNRIGVVVVVVVVIDVVVVGGDVVVPRCSLAAVALNCWLSGRTLLLSLSINSKTGRWALFVISACIFNEFNQRRDGSPTFSLPLKTKRKEMRVFVR